MAKHGKRMIGWDEILDPNLPKDILVQSLRRPSQQHLSPSERHHIQSSSRAAQQSSPLKTVHEFRGAGLWCVPNTCELVLLFIGNKSSTTGRRRGTTSQFVQHFGPCKRINY